MSLLHQQQSNQPDQLQRMIESVKRVPKTIADQMFRQWLNAFDALWSNNKFTLTERIEALGTDAVELIELNNQLVEFMLQQFTGKRDDLVEIIQQKIAQIPQFTPNPDGSITLD
jgi:hypothetical protein